MPELLPDNRIVYEPLQFTGSCSRHPDAQDGAPNGHVGSNCPVCAAAAGPGAVPPFQSSSSDAAATGGWCCKRDWSEVTAKFLGLLQSTSVPSRSLPPVVSRTREVLLRKLQLLLVCVIHLLIIYVNIITEQLSKQSPPSSTPSPPNKPV